MTELRREVPIYRQIEALIRADIESGKIPCGSRFPTVQSLAKQYATSVFTIQKALNILAEDGLIERMRGRGTLVTSNCTKLSNVGIYFGSELWQGSEMEYSRSLYERLSCKLDSKKIKHRLWVDTRTSAKLSEPLPELVEELSRRAYQGLIVGIANPSEMSWLTKLGLLLALNGTAPIPSRVGEGTANMFDLVLEDLKERGCRTVGLITPVPVGESPVPAFAGNDEGFFNNFIRHLGTFGLTTQNSWVRAQSKTLPNREHEEFGYREFQSIWNQPQRPDGLFVYTDIVGKGVITSILQKSISVPKDLKLVFHKNEGTQIYCPLEASWLVTNPGDVADALISLLERQFSGQPVEPIFVPFGFEKATERSNK